MKTKKIIALLLTVTLCFYAFFIHTEVTSLAATTQYPISEITRTNTVGDVIRLRYFVSAGSFAECIQGRITYDSTKLSVNEDSFNVGDSYSYSTNTAGIINFFAISIPNNLDFTSDTLVLEVEFTVNNPGSSDFKADLIILNYDGIPISPNNVQTRLEAYPINDVSISSVTISGIAVVEQTLTANPQFTYDVAENADTYQWYRSSDGSTWTPISGATSKTYTLDSNDINKYIKVVATYNDISKTSANTEPVLQMGDVDKDGSVTIADVTLIMKYVASSVTLDEQQLKAADVNRDGTVDTRDVVIIQKYLAGIYDEL